MKTYLRIYRYGYYGELLPGLPPPGELISEAEFNTIVSGGSNLVLHLTEFYWTDFHDSWWGYLKSDLYHASGPVPGPALGERRSGDGSDSFELSFWRSKYLGVDVPPAQAAVYVEIDAESEYPIPFGNRDESILCVCDTGDGSLRLTIWYDTSAHFTVNSIKVYLPPTQQEGFWSNFRVCKEIAG